MRTVGTQWRDLPPSRVNVYPAKRLALVDIKAETVPGSCGKNFLFCTPRHMSSVSCLSKCAPWAGNATPSRTGSRARALATVAPSTGKRPTRTDPLPPRRPQPSPHPSRGGRSKSHSAFLIAGPVPGIHPGAAACLHLPILRRGSGCAASCTIRFRCATRPADTADSYCLFARLNQHSVLHSSNARISNS